jgi:Membrane proteins related to metalloendopeptidases
MKKIIIFALCLFTTLPAISQEKKRWFKKRESRKSTITRDTLYIYLPAPELDSLPDDIENAIVSPIDTLSTDDKFRKVILFDDSTWTYYDIPKPTIPDSLITDYWTSNQVHAYRDISIHEIPDEIDLMLVDSLHGYHIPTHGKIISSYRFRNGRSHHGVDIKLAYGDPVYAAFDGMVRSALPTRQTGGYGNVLVIRHSNGLETYYAHLSKYKVKSGDLVKAGEIIGYGGATGRASGTHLHFETRYMGQSFDPERVFDFETETLRDPMLVLKKHYFSIYSHQGQSDKQSKEASERRIHTIKSGDTLGALAKKYGTTIEKICKLNNISRNSILRIGQRLIVR